MDHDIVTMLETSVRSATIGTDPRRLAECVNFQPCEILSNADYPNRLQ